MWNWSFGRGPVFPEELGTYLTLTFQSRFIFQLFWQRPFIAKDGLFSLFICTLFFHLFSPVSTHFCTPEVWGVISWFFRLPRSTAKNSRSTAKSIRSTEINRGSTVCPRFVHASVGMWAYETFESMTYREVLGKGKKQGPKNKKQLLYEDGLFSSRGRLGLTKIWLL